MAPFVRPQSLLFVSLSLSPRKNFHEEYGSSGESARPLTGVDRHRLTTSTKSKDPCSNGVYCEGDGLPWLHPLQFPVSEPLEMCPLHSNGSPFPADACTIVPRTPVCSTRALCPIKTVATRPFLQNGIYVTNRWNSSRGNDICCRTDKSCFHRFPTDFHQSIKAPNYVASPSWKSKAWKARR